MAAFGQDFLTDTDLFPARISGEPWGEMSLILNVAGDRYLVTGLSRTQASVIRQRFVDVVFDQHKDPKKNIVPIRIFRANSNDFRDDPPRGEPRTLETLPQSELVQVAGYHFMALLHGFPTPATGMWTCETAGLAFRLAFENMFRLMVAYRLLMRGALLLHAAAVVSGAQAEIFVGRSGYGKSTVSRLSRDAGCTVLSDDMVALCMDNGELRALPLPFTGELDPATGMADCYPVRALLWLNKGNHHELSALSRAAALSALIVCAPYVNNDPNRCEQLMQNADRLAGGAPAYTLTFARNGGFRELLNQRLAAPWTA